MQIKLNRLRERSEAPVFQGFLFRWQLVDTDPNIQIEKKHELLDHLLTKQPQELLKGFVEFCRLNQLQGPEEVVEQGGPLGHTVASSRMLIELSREFSFQNEEMEEVLNSIKNTDGVLPHKEFIERFGNIRMGQYILWSFRNPENQDSPLEGLDLTDLSCRLGLEKTDYVAFAHRLGGELKTTRATAFDAEANAAWQPGGRTIPRQDCGNKYPLGLPEITHQPGHYRDVVTNIFPSH